MSRPEKRPHPHGEEEQSLDLAEAGRQLVDECRMVLPGIQALFGFQMISVFTDSFGRLSKFNQTLHLGATLLIVVAIALVMAPAALHRQAESRRMTRSFLHLASKLLLMAMLTLATGICVEVYLVASLIWSEGPALATALIMAATFIALWIVVPLYRRHAA